jgi:hypothetical protein
MPFAARLTVSPPPPASDELAPVLRSYG